MKLALLAAAAALLSIPLVTQAQSKPPAYAMFYSSDGTGNVGTWVPASGGGSGALPNTIPPQIGMYCSSDGTGNIGTWVPCNPTGGGGSLPTAASPGQIISSTAAGTSYSVQGQVFYSRAGDTIASIEAECSSLCTYVVTTPQTITLAANHTLSSNVQLDFSAGGKWTVNGAFTLTIPGNITGTLNQHFAGTSTLSFGSNQRYANVEWWGAVADWNGTTGTDNTTAINACLSTMTAGQCVLQAGSYKTTAALTISQSIVGIVGAGMAQPSTAYLVNNPPASAIVNTSASADILDVWGTNSSTGNLFGNVLKDFSVFRTITPTTGDGVSIKYNFASMIDRVNSADSIHDFAFLGVGSNGTGVIQNTIASNSLGSGTYNGYYVDTTTGIPSPSLRLRNNFYFNGSAGTAYGLYSAGTTIKDLMSWNFETAGATIGVNLNFTPGGDSWGDSDIHFYGTINDTFTTSGFLITGLNQAYRSAVEINGGESTSQSASGGKTIDIENSAGVSVIGHQMWGNSSYFIYNNGAGSVANRYIGNYIYGATVHGIYFNGSTGGDVVQGNNIYGSSATDLLAFIGGTVNTTVSGNVLGGTGTTAITADSSSVNLMNLTQNPITGTWTTQISNSGFNPLYIGNGVWGPASISVGATCNTVAGGWWQFDNNGQPSWCNGAYGETSFLSLQGYKSVGTKFTTSGCSISATTGGSTAGTFTLGANSCTAVITPGGANGLTATNGWTCQAHDRTAPTVLIGGESSSTTTTASITIPAGAGATDVISFSCIAF